MEISSLAKPPSAPRGARPGGHVTAQELQSLREFPRHFELDGAPVRQVARSGQPETYLGEGRWEAYASPQRLMVEGKFITRKRFDSLCRAVDRFIDAGGPFLEVSSEPSTRDARRG